MGGVEDGRLARVDDRSPAHRDVPVEATLAGEGGGGEEGGIGGLDPHLVVEGDVEAGGGEGSAHRPPPGAGRGACDR